VELMQLLVIILLRDSCQAHVNKSIYLLQISSILSHIARGFFYGINFMVAYFRWV
jgi:hypothetical protein